MTRSQIDPRRLERLADKEETLESLQRFARGIDRFDRELFLSAFHADCEIAAGSFVGCPVELWDWSHKLHDVGQTMTQHCLLNHTCDLDGDVAHCETYYLFVARNRDGTTWQAGGRYITRQERREGIWRIATHTNAFEWAAQPTTLPRPFGDVPDIDANGPVARGREDMSYARPLTNRRKRNIPEVG